MTLAEEVEVLVKQIPQPVLSGAHFINVHVRINGKWRIYELDGLKKVRDLARRVGEMEIDLANYRAARPRGTKP